MFTKMESLTYPCQHNTLKEFNFPYIHATPRDKVTLQRNEVANRNAN